MPAQPRRDKTTSKTRSLYWMITINNPPPEWYSVRGVTAYLRRAENHQILGIKWQIEKGETCGTIHVQGYVECIKKQSRKQISKYIPIADVQSRQGNHEQAIAYVTKEDTRQSGPFQYGSITKTKAKKQAKFVQLRDMVRAGCTMEQVFDEMPGMYYRHTNAIKESIRMCAKPRKEAPKIIVCVGPTGTGKTRYAHSLGNEENIYTKPAGSKWFCGYEQKHEVVILDEFNGSWMPINNLKTLTDRYTLTVETKGGSVNFNAPIVIFTSNQPIATWYPNKDKHHINAVYRRITEYRWMPKLDEETWIIISSENYPDWEDRLHAAESIPGLINEDTDPATELFFTTNIIRRATSNRTIEPTNFRIEF